MEIIEEVVEPGTASAEALIVAIKTNADLSIEEAHAIIGEYFPSNQCPDRLEAYINALFSVAGISEASWVNFRDFIHNTEMDVLQRVLPNIRLIADQYIQEVLMEKFMVISMIAQLEAEIAKGNPTKTEPDEEAMNFYNSNCMDVMMYNQNVEQLAMHEQMLEDIKAR